MTQLLEHDERIRFIKETTQIKEILVEVLAFQKKNLVLYNGQKFEDYTQHFFHIMARLRYNTQGLINHMDSYKEDYRLKMCISQPLRSMCADMLTALYLLSLYDKADPTHEAVKNELDILTTEYLHFLEQTIKEDHEWMLKIGVEHQTLQEKWDWFKSLAPDLLDNNGKIRSRESLRLTTKDYIKNGLKPFGNFLTESEKYQRIKQTDYADYGFIFVAFKYYSQFQHFNLMSKKMIEEKPFCDNQWMVLIIDHTLMVMDIILQISKSPNPEFRNEIKELRNKVALYLGAEVIA